jgi:hypothetical protein
MIPKQVESEIILCVVNALKQITENVFYGKSHTVYPKINIDLRKIESVDEMHRYRLVCDYYADDGQPITTVSMHESAREILNNGQAETENGALITFREDSSGGMIEEPSSEKIVHYEDSYEVVYWMNREI